MIGIIIQARMGSTRLAGKVLMKIGDKKLLEHILFRLEFLKTENIKIVIATTNMEKDNIIEDFCNNEKVLCYRGDENNVLQRYYECAKLYNFTDIVRLTADNPFVDIEELDQMIQLHIESDADYTESFENLPIGVGSEIFTFEALEKSYKDSYMSHHFEHVDEYILENPDKFKISILSVEKSKYFPKVRLTIDTKEDLLKARFIVKMSNSKYISTSEAIALENSYNIK